MKNQPCLLFLTIMGVASLVIIGGVFLSIMLVDRSSPDLVVIRERPLYPLEQLESMEGLGLIRASFQVHDSQHPLVSYDADGEPEYHVYDMNLFPADLWVVFTAGMDAPLVFLACSPHGGCLLRWEDEQSQLVDPCYGSRFSVDGEFIEGPAQRHLDQLPAEVRAGVIWVRNEIIYGEVHSAHNN